MSVEPLDIAILRATVTLPDETGPRTDALMPIALLRSPSFRVLTKSAHLALARIVIEIANGRHEITHQQFVRYGVDRGAVAHAITELEALGVVTVHRAHANSYDLSQRWRDIHTYAQASAIRDKARAFGIFRRRKVARQTERINRERRLAQIRSALDAPTQAAALAALDGADVATFTAITDEISRSHGVVGAAITYERLTDRVGVNRNTLAASLRVLSALRLIEVTRGRHCRNVYRIADGWRALRSTDDARAIAEAARAPHRR